MCQGTNLDFIQFTNASQLGTMTKKDRNPNGLEGFDMIVMIDNFDSFVYNLVRYFEELNEEIVVFRNNEVTIEEIENLNPNGIVISPGPCTPNEAGISLDIIHYFHNKIPILGVCLGHQCIIQYFGGNIIKGIRPMHGKVTPIEHNNKGIFSTLNLPLTVTHYNSLVGEKASLPKELEITAWTDQGEIMGIQHVFLPIYGVQFHPEAHLTEQGHLLLKNFISALER